MDALSLGPLDMPFRLRICDVYIDLNNEPYSVREREREREGGYRRKRQKKSKIRQIPITIVERFLGACRPDLQPAAGLVAPHVV